MTTALIEARPMAPAGRRPAGRRGDRPDDRRLTLAERLDAVWTGLHADGEAECPICRERMRMRQGAGECGGCGSKMG